MCDRLKRAPLWIAVTLPAYGGTQRRRCPHAPTSRLRRRDDWAADVVHAQSRIAERYRDDDILPAQPLEPRDHRM